MAILGIDLSGPRNVQDTCAVAFAEQGGQLAFRKVIHAAGDQEIIDLVSEMGGQGNVAVGLDAPLSYQRGGGDRPSDRELRRSVHEKGGRVGVMPPTMIRMVYLTLRGIALTRALESLKPQIDVKLVEVHPGASMLLRGAPLGDVAMFKRDVSARVRLLHWLDEAGMRGLAQGAEPSDHFVAACAAALATWQWSLGNAAWCHPAQPPEHPYDFAC